MNRVIAMLHLGILTCLLGVCLSTNAATPVWIDTDPACDGQGNHDVDDCWALARALHSEGLAVRGVSTVFGNSSERNSFDVLANILERLLKTDERPPVFRGATHPLGNEIYGENAAVISLASVLRGEPLTIIALGPLTNIAILIDEYPEVIGNIERLIAVAGQRPEQGARFHPGASPLYHVHDFNFRKDVAAFQRVLDAELPLTLLPYEVAAKVRIADRDLSRMATEGARGAMLAALAQPWLNHWKSTFRNDSFYPFDSLAVAYAIDAQRFSCDSLPLGIEYNPSLFLGSRDRLLASEEFSDSAEVDYCYDVEPGFKEDLISSLQR